MSDGGWPAAPPLAPRPAPNRARRTALVLGLVAVGVAFIVVYALGFYRYANADHLGILDDTVVSGQAREACDQLTADVRTAAGTPDAAARIRLQDNGIRALISSMEDLGHERLAGDHPALGWVDDWRTLLALREAYADALVAGGHPTLVVPTVDDIPITQRMSELSTCTVVDELAAVA